MLQNNTKINAIDTRKQHNEIKTTFMEFLIAYYNIKILKI